MQMINSSHYAGKNVRFSAEVRSAGAERWAALWTRVDGADGKMLAFDNMQSRPIKGTTEWKHYDVVLPVDAAATAVAFGVLLDGKGSVWIRNLTFESVAGSFPTTARTAPALRLEPNLTLSP
jgi:hypothetical protein